MPIARFFTPLELHDQSPITLEGSEAHHLSTVIRKKAGDSIELFNGRGALAQAKVTHVEKKRVEVTPTAVTFTSAPERQCALVQSMLRAHKLDLIVEKATELGIDVFHLFAADHSEKQTLTPKQLERLHTISISACKQSGRLHLPTFHIYAALEKITLPHALYGDPSDSAPSITALPADKRCVFINGPESGFSAREIEYCIEQRYTGVRISQNTLRTETAAIAATALMLEM